MKRFRVVVSLMTRENDYQLEQAASAQESAASRSRLRPSRNPVGASQSRGGIHPRTAAERTASPDFFDWVRSEGSRPHPGPATRRARTQRRRGTAHSRSVRKHDRERTNDRLTSNAAVAYS